MSHFKKNISITTILQLFLHYSVHKKMAKTRFHITEISAFKNR